MGALRFRRGTHRLLNAAKQVPNGFHRGRSADNSHHNILERWCVPSTRHIPSIAHALAYHPWKPNHYRGPRHSRVPRGRVVERLIHPNLCVPLGCNGTDARLPLGSRRLLSKNSCLRSLFGQPGRVEHNGGCVVCEGNKDSTARQGPGPILRQLPAICPIRVAPRCPKADHHHSSIPSCARGQPLPSVAGHAGHEDRVAKNAGG
jgi:hypothetical protein